MIGSYKKYCKNKIDQDDIHRHYHLCIDDSNKFYDFMKSMIPVIRYHYRKIHNPVINSYNFDDVCNDVFEKCINTMNNHVVFDNPMQTFTYMSAISRTVMLKKMQLYNSYKNVDVISFQDLLVSNSFTSSHILLKIHAKQVLELLVNTFNKSIRFLGAEKKLCLIIFNLILKEEQIDKKYLSIKYKLDADFYVNYVTILIKKILYQFKDIKFNELTVITNEQSIYYNRRQKQDQDYIVSNS